MLWTRLIGNHGVREFNETSLKPSPRNGEGESESVERDGYAVVPNVLSPASVSYLISLLAQAGGDGVRRKAESVYAIRNLLDAFPEVDALARSATLTALVEPILGPEYQPVRGILFDKTAGANWHVLWHQDLAIAVRERKEVEGFDCWTVKAGVPHVQPPVWVLEKMLAVRLHLDDCDETNGPLQVIPGSHAKGRLGPAEIEKWRASATPVTCVAPAGGAVIMRPLLLHASSSAQSPRHRRVVHIEYAAVDLPGGLEWYSQASS